jgi:polyphosphate glucokinase
MEKDRMKILVIDVGGTHVKVLATGHKKLVEIPSGPKMTAKKMVAAVRQTTAGWKYDAVSIGYPGPVIHGHPVSEPHNLGGGWVGFDYQKAFGRPVKIINDAAMQALGSYRGGRMLFLGLGTGLGSALIVDGVLEPMELAHLPYKKDGTYEDYAGVAGLMRLGKKKWRHHVEEVVKQLKTALQADYVVLGGGNAKRLKRPPPGSSLGDNSNAFQGGYRLWTNPDKLQPPSVAPDQRRKSVAVNNPVPAKVIFLFDVDNTLLDNDRVTADLKRHLERQVGPEHAQRYWSLFEQLRSELGYADYLGALQRYRSEYPHDPKLLTVSHFLVNYPFANRLFPDSLDVIEHVKQWGQPVILSDGDVVFQPRKVDRSGIFEAVDGNVLIYVHKEKELDDVEQRHPAEHYVLVDDKLRILAAIKKIWGARVTTVFVRQGHYALDPKILTTCPAADVSIERIGDLLEYDLQTLLEAARRLSGSPQTQVPSSRSGTSRRAPATRRKA